MWYLFIEIATSRLVSQGSQPVVSLPAGIKQITLGSKPPAEEMYDPATETYIPRPAPVWEDRLADIEANADYSDATQNLNAAKKAKLRNALLFLLGNARYRRQNEPVPVEGGNP